MSTIHLVIYNLVVENMLFLGMIIAFVISLPAIKKYSKAPVWVWLALLILLVSSFYIRMFEFPHYHFMYSDDFYPIEIANKVVSNRIGEINMPTFIANSIFFVPVFMVFGVRDAYTFYTMITIGIFSLLIFFFLVQLIIKNHWAALFATALLAFNIVHIRYSLSTYDPMLVFFLTVLALYTFFLFLESRFIPALYLSIFSLGFLVHLRTEMVLFVVFLFPLYIQKFWRKLTMKKILFPWILFLFIILQSLPNVFMHVTSVRGQTVWSWGFGFLIKNINLVINQVLVSGNQLMLLFFALAIAGAVFLAFEKNKNALYVLLSSVFFAAFYMLIEPAHQGRGRFLIYAISGLYLAISYGLYSLLKYIRNKKVRLSLGALILCYLFVFGLTNSVKTALALKNDYRVNRLYLNTKIPEYLEQTLPSDCLIISAHPTRFTATTKLKAVYIDSFDQDRYKNMCTVFVEDISCSLRAEDSEKCARFKNKYNLTFYGYINSSFAKIPRKDLFIRYNIYSLE